MVTQKCYRYIYGPVSSWRIGRSLGIDPISRKGKFCTFDCIYCQLGPTAIFTDKRKIFVSAEKVIEEIKTLPQLDIDYITFSGRGEPTLAKNLNEMIDGIKKIRKEDIAVITNASLIDRPDVQADLRLADFVMVKLDACSEVMFNKINKPLKGISFNKILKGIKDFRRSYSGKMALQMMFVDVNKSCAKALAEMARDINPEEIQINTPLRPCRVRALKKSEVEKIEIHFEDLNFISVYRGTKQKVRSIDWKVTLQRRGRDDQG